MTRVSAAKAYGSRTANRARHGGRKVRAKVRDSFSRMKTKSPRSSITGMVNSILQAPQTRTVLEELYRRSQGGRLPGGMSAMIPAATAAYGMSQMQGLLPTNEPAEQQLPDFMRAPEDTMASHWRRRLAYESDLQSRRGKRALKPRPQRTRSAKAKSGIKRRR